MTIAPASQGAPRGLTPERELLARLGAPATLVKAGVILVAIAALYYEWFVKQHLFSSRFPEDWAHAYMVPAISAYLIWTQRERLTRAPAATFWPGLAPLLLGCVCYAFFSIGAVRNHMAQGFSLVLTVFGVTLLLLGPRVMEVLFLPISYLVFGVTISEKIMSIVTYKLQDLAARGGHILLNMIGVTTDRAGNTLHIIKSSGEIVPLGVAEACSGMRTLVAFMALGAAVALVACKSWWQRVVLFMLAVPIALLLNVVRVAVLGVVSLYDPEASKGQAHTLIGTLLLLPGLALFMATVWALNKAVAPPPEAKGAGR